MMEEDPVIMLEHRQHINTVKPTDSLLASVMDSLLWFALPIHKVY
jgi:hypothetical protein